MMITYFDSLRFENIPKEIKKILGNRDIQANIYKIQTEDSVMCRCFCIRFIGFMLKGKKMIDYTNLLTVNKYEKNDKIMVKCFK